MLVLSRRVNEEIVVAGNIRISIVSIKGDRVRLGIVAPKNVSVDRAEVHERRMQFLDIPMSELTDLHSSETRSDLPLLIANLEETVSHD